MPEISRFLGIVIAILYRDHEPPHFHATYGEYEITGTHSGRCRHRQVSAPGTGARPGMVRGPPAGVSRRTGSGRGTACRYSPLNRLNE